MDNKNDGFSETPEINGAETPVIPEAPAMPDLPAIEREPEDIPRAEDIPEPGGFPYLGAILHPEDTPRTEDTPCTEDTPRPEDTPCTEDIPRTEDTPVSPVPERADTGAYESYTDYSPYGYARAAAELMEPPPKRSKAGLVFGILIGMTLTLTGVLIAFFVMGGRMEITLPEPGDPWARSDDRPTPTETLPPNDTPAAPRPSGGGDAKLDIVPVVPARPEQALGGPLTNRQIVEKGRPSVVCVLVENTAQGYTGLGSGIIMAEEGQHTYIITNCHVVRDYNLIKVLLPDGEEHPADLVGMDNLSDLAVVKIKVTGLQAAEFGESDALHVGDPVVVIGNPVGLELQGTATSGMISAINRDIKVSGRVMTMLQTDASVNQGNSGGPMFNEYGQVVGIISSKIMGSFTSAAEGLGFAIPIAIAKPVIDDLISLGYVSGRPAIGIADAVSISASESRFFSVPRGVRVLAISESCDAYKQGLRVDDIIFKVNGQEVYSVDDINGIKNKFSVGDSMTAMVYRDRQEFEITFLLMEEGQLR